MIGMLKRVLSVRAVYVALVVLAAAMFFQAVPAGASTPAYCDRNSECMWNNIHYEGANGYTDDTWDMTEYAPYFSQYFYDDGITVDRTVSSSYNSNTASDRQFIFWFGQNCTGAYFTISVNGGDSDFTNGSPTVHGSGSTPNDAARSGEFSNYGAYC